ncbi:pyridoxamine 5'-phosphate oxidase family protein [Schlegelella sp. S2-27]|uniref:Pyridoxamine 5'-phosphate oxidase family protein n=1 Tax=Caldimonas mangrovi TaxID=2944811 RepID=A0ABT0YTA8_9BURK|nr:pyridoxamine 5'-phosphate oxidase family protein [Caldimonas mangrovi]MCM5681078.1 pyridoxamine 5'-phosphate oxidase family protein [Caldimonas mangrovi]
MDASHVVHELSQLESLFGAVGEPSLRKQVAHLHPVYRPMIAASPFAVLTTVGPDGLDASPRGDAPGFVRVKDDKTLLLPERRGNNRIDSLRNILHDPRVGLLFLIPGVGETLRVNGKARISVDPALLEALAVDGAPPKCVLEITVEEVFFQCARAVLRSKLWTALPDSVLAQLPSPGTVLAALTDDQVDGPQYDQGLRERQRATLY